MIGRQIQATPVHHQVLPILNREKKKKKKSFLNLEVTGSISMWWLDRQFVVVMWFDARGWFFHGGWGRFEGWRIVGVRSQHLCGGFEVWQWSWALVAVHVHRLGYTGLCLVTVANIRCLALGLCLPIGVVVQGKCWVSGVRSDEGSLQGGKGYGWLRFQKLKRWRKFWFLLKLVKLGFLKLMIPRADYQPNGHLFPKFACTGAVRLL